MQLSPVKRAIVELRTLRAKLKEAERVRDEPIAVIGMGCRFPGGANDPDSLWRMLCEGIDAIREVPPDRWDINEFFDPNPDAPGKMSTRWAGFLDEYRRVRRRFLRSLSARGGDHGSAAAAVSGGRLGGSGERRPVTGKAAGQFHGRVCGDRQQRLRPVADAVRRPRRRSTPTSPPARATASPPAACRTPWVCTVPASLSTPPAPLRSWRFIWPARACAWENAEWRWPAAST